MRTRTAWLALLCALPGIEGLAAAHHLDPGNTHIALEIEHLGLRWFSAEFHELSGDFALGVPGAEPRLTVSVDTASIDCRSLYWNERLRSPQWLDTARYPQMTYRSTRIDFDGTTRATVQGELTLHGITRPLALTVTEIDCPLGTGLVTPRCRFTGRATLRRSDFGIPHGFFLGGDQVRILVRGS